MHFEGTPKTNSKLEVPELTDRQRKIVDLTIRNLGLSEEDLALPVNFQGYSATIGDGIQYCADHIAGMTPTATRAFVDGLKELSHAQQQSNAS